MFSWSLVGQHFHEPFPKEFEKCLGELIFPACLNAKSHNFESCLVCGRGFNHCLMQAHLCNLKSMGIAQSKGKTLKVYYYDFSPSV